MFVFCLILYFVNSHIDFCYTRTLALSVGFVCVRARACVRACVQFCPAVPEKVFFFFFRNWPLLCLFVQFKCKECCTLPTFTVLQLVVYTLMVLAVSKTALCARTGHFCVCACSFGRTEQPIPPSSHNIHRMIFLHTRAGCMTFCFYNECCPAVLNKEVLCAEAGHIGEN